MKNENKNFIDGLIYFLLMFFIIWILTSLDKRIEKPKTNVYRPFYEERF